MPAIYEHPLYTERKEEWKDIRLFFEGERAVKKNASRFLPRPEKCTDREYASYATRAFFFGAVCRTVSGLVGAVDRQAPVANVPDAVRPYLLDIDGQGTDLRSFTKDLTEETLLIGRAGALLDAGADGGRPYLVSYKAEDILNWAEDNSTGQTQLIWVLLREYYYEHVTDSQQMVKRTRYRELILENGVYKQLIRTGGDSDGRSTQMTTEEVRTVQPVVRGKPLDHIPFVFFGASSSSAKVDKPPTLDLTNKNIENFRIGADYANALWFTGNPLLYVKGVEATTSIVVGANHAVVLPEMGEIGFAECSGHGISPLEKRFETTKLEMAVLGARLLESTRPGVEAAETIRIRQAGEMSVLSSVVTSIDNGISKLLWELTWWTIGQDADVSYTINRDFVDIQVTPTFIKALQDLLDRGYISFETFFYNLAKGDVYPPGSSFTTEKDKIDRDGGGLPQPPYEEQINARGGGMNRQGQVGADNTVVIPDGPEE